MSLLDRLKAWRSDKQLEELDEERRGELRREEATSERIIRARSPRGTPVLADDDLTPRD